MPPWTSSRPLPRRTPLTTRRSSRADGAVPVFTGAATGPTVPLQGPADRPSTPACEAGLSQSRSGAPRSSASATDGVDQSAPAASGAEAAGSPADGVNRPVPNDEALESLLAMGEAACQRTEAASAAAVSRSDHGWLVEALEAPIIDLLDRARQPSDIGFIRSAVEAAQSSTLSLDRWTDVIGMLA
eukprot:12365948-Alexandrium_andersonii.AAC.1